MKCPSKLSEVEAARGRSEFRTTVRGCARCGKMHKNILFLRLKKPTTDKTHWSLCPNTQEPILLKIVEV